MGKMVREGISTFPPYEKIITRTSLEQVNATTPDQDIVAFTTIQCIPSPVSSTVTPQALVIIPYVLAHLLPGSHISIVDCPLQVLQQTFKPKTVVLPRQKGFTTITIHPTQSICIY